ncbi:MAG: hypothetical protein HeimC2_30790 [Candidatus Heimdallarchaeota archaeon LC_2]|nr:MAG: hypothetical protein HeimC2_30790 [Candidatus Heimdallarchaeota archaeon LC_2]
MLCKLYIAKYKEGIPDNTRFKDFEKFYEENGVKVIGGWENADDKDELYFITGYRDQNHYDEFVANMKNNARYQELSADLGSERESVKVVTLNQLADITSG